MTDRKRCAYCAEEIRNEAVRCPHCRSRLDGFAGEHWHRAHDDSRFAGVASAIAHSLSVPVGLVRLAFVISSFIHLVGVVVYAGLWAILPSAPGDASALEKGLARAQQWASWLAGQRRDGDAATPPTARTPVVPTTGATVINDGGDAQR